MTNQTEMQKFESGQATERMPQRKVFMPRADVVETKDSVVVLADMPGVDEKSLDITLEKNVLTIFGSVEAQWPKGHTPEYVEYDIGDYRRAFTLSDEVDREGIQASVKNGVLRLTLPKAGPAKAKKITVKAE